MPSHTISPTLSCHLKACRCSERAAMPAADALGCPRRRSAVYILPQLHDALPQLPPPAPLLAACHSGAVIRASGSPG